MSRDRYSYSVAKGHARPATQRAIVALLIVTGVMLLVLGKMQHPTLIALRQHLLQLATPVMQLVSQPVSATKKLADSTSSVLDTAEENRRLSAENERLRHWQSVAQALKAENQSLRALTGYKPVESASYVTARVVGISPSAFAQVMTINAGETQGIVKLQPVVDAFGLVGRVIETAPDAARVMLLSDAASRVPVITGTSRQHAILSGSGDGLLRLAFLDDGAKLQAGEPVVTSPEGTLIPGGIAIGHVLENEGSGYLVKPLRPLTQAEYVRVIAAKAPTMPTDR